MLLVALARGAVVDKLNYKILGRVRRDQELRFQIYLDVEGSGGPYLVAPFGLITQFNLLRRTKRKFPNREFQESSRLPVCEVNLLY